MSANEAVGGDLVGLAVDATVCIGIGRCEMLEPDAFMVSDDAIAEVDPETRFTRVRANEIVMECPSGAISIATDDD